MKYKFSVIFLLALNVCKAQTDDIKEPDFLTPFVFFNSELTTREIVQKKLEANSTMVLEGVDAAIIQKEIQKFNAFAKDLNTKREALSSRVRLVNNYYSILTQSKDILSVRQQIDDKVKAKTEFEKKFLDDLKKQTNTEGLYIVVLGSDANSLNLSSGQYKEIAQQFLVTRAVKELDGAFITSFTSIIDRKDVQTKVTSKVKGKMSLKDTPFEKRRLLAKDYIMLLDVNVQPLSDTIIGESTNAIITAKSIVNCKNRDDVTALFTELNINETDRQTINSKIEEVLPLIESVNDANTKTVQELWDNLNKSLIDIQKQIDDLKAFEKEKSKRIKELCKSLFTAPLVSKNIVDSISLIDDKLKDMSLKIEQRMELIESKNLFKLENREIKLNSNLSPIEALAEAIERLSKEMESAYAGQFAFSEELVMQNKMVQDIRLNKAYKRRKNINKVWVYLTPTNDESYKLSLISKFDIIKTDKQPVSEIKPVTVKQPEIPKPVKKTYGFDLAIQPDLTGVRDEDGYIYNYFGEVKNGLPNGKGKQQFDNGNEYEGLFENGKRNGQGIFKWKNGDTYQGSFLNDKCHGVGSLIYANGDVYDGAFNNDLMQGKGIFKWIIGQVYDGNWFENKMEGEGIFNAPNGLEIINCAGAVRYVGKFKNNMKNGMGKCFDGLGRLIYEGNFVLDYPTDIYPNRK